MTPRLVPMRFDSIFKPRPWGGRRLSALFGKALPPGDPIGEAWELADLPGDESRVRGGPLDGVSLRELVGDFGGNLLGDVPTADGRFPLLVKFLDAREHLSVQVHPHPDRAAREGLPIKHEAWYVVDADPNATMFIGLRPGVGPADVARCAGRPAFVDLLRPWPVKPGQCFYLPSGTAHALGAGIVVAEIQTPSDVTYRLYDWDRVGLDGRPRALHLTEAMEHVRYDVQTGEIAQPTRPTASALGPARRAATCASFAIDCVDVPVGVRDVPAVRRPYVLVVLAGRPVLAWNDGRLPLSAGDVALLPADCPPLRVEMTAPGSLLEVRFGAD